MTSLERFDKVLDRPLIPAARICLLLLVILLVVGIATPLWRIQMEAPQYPQGLYMDIYSHALTGGNDGHDITEINTLNHYIGMHRIDRQTLVDLDFMPFLLGGLGLLVLRVAALGNVRALIDLTVLSIYAATFALGRFVYRLYVFGHELDPTAPVKVKGFTPVIIGTKQIANFTTHSYPRVGALLIGLFVLGLAGLVIWHLLTQGVKHMRRLPDE